MLAGTRAGASLWLLAGLLLASTSHAILLVRLGTATSIDLLAMSAMVLLATLWPILAPSQVREQPWAWRTAALAGPVYLLHLRFAWIEVWSARAIGLLPILLGLLSLRAADAARGRRARKRE